MALLSAGGYAQYAIVHPDHIMRVPSGYSWQQAAAIPEVWSPNLFSSSLCDFFSFDDETMRTKTG